MTGRRSTADTREMSAHHHADSGTSKRRTPSRLVGRFGCLSPGAEASWEEADKVIEWLSGHKDGPLSAKSVRS
jgi:hypothetical protein